MIYLYTGTPGSGKSLHMARVIYWLLKRKKPVACNFPIDLKKISKRNYDKLPFVYMDNMELNPNKLVNFACEYWKKKGGRIREGEITLFLDESQILFNSRDWRQAGRDGWLRFFTQHRKYGYDVILTAQFDEMLDKQIRALVEYQVIHRKVSNFGIVGKILSLFTLGKLFVSVVLWYPMGEKISSEFFTAKKRYYSIYDTYDTFAEFEEGEGTENT